MLNVFEFAMLENAIVLNKTKGERKGKNFEIVLTKFLSIRTNISFCQFIRSVKLCRTNKRDVLRAK